MKLTLIASYIALCSVNLARAAPPQKSTQFSAQPFFYKGFDLSSLHILEEANTTYEDTARHNETRPAEDILGDGGMNTVRLRYGTTNRRSTAVL